MQYHDGRGRFMSTGGDNTIQLVCTLNELMKKPLDKMTGEELRWVMKVNQERPAWAIQTLNRLASESQSA